MNLVDLTEVWNAPSVGFALVAGLLLGYFAIGRYASDPVYASGQATPREYGVLTAALATAIGLIFFGFQVLGTYLDGDPGWTRVASRFFIWFAYCAAIGVGTTVRLQVYSRKKREQAHDRALAALDTGAVPSLDEPDALG